MPEAAPQGCKEPGCTNLVYKKAARGFCVRHLRETRACRPPGYRRRNMSDEDKARDRFYSTQDWARLRSRFIHRNPLCCKCLDRGIVRAADVVDHIIEIKDDPTRRLDDQNLQPLCHRCHNAKTQDERRRRDREAAQNA